MILPLWVVEPLVFDDDEDDLLLPVEALIPDEVALLDYEATVHTVKVEDTASRHPPGGAPGCAPDGGRGANDDDDSGDDRGIGRGVDRPVGIGGARGIHVNTKDFEHFFL
jgi:hypothetical protein